MPVHGRRSKDVASVPLPVYWQAGRTNLDTCQMVFNWGGEEGGIGNIAGTGKSGIFGECIKNSPFMSVLGIEACIAERPVVIKPRGIGGRGIGGMRIVQHCFVSSCACLTAPQESRVSQIRIFHVKHERKGDGILCFCSVYPRE